MVAGTALALGDACVSVLIRRVASLGRAVAEPSPSACVTTGDPREPAVALARVRAASVRWSHVVSCAAGRLGARGAEQLRAEVDGWVPRNDCGGSSLTIDAAFRAVV